MSSVADCLRQHAPAYLEKFADDVPTGHRKVLGAITRCRTGELGGVLYQCRDCGREHWVGRSCGNRHCPSCQAEKTAEWLEKQTSRLLPVHHFLVTFTVPHQLRMPLRGSQSDGYRALFTAAADSLRDVAWQSTADNFLVHHATLIRVYKAKLTDALRGCGIYDEVPESAWFKKSVVDIEPVGDGKAVLKYLAPYVHRVAISDKRIVSCDDQSVTYTYTPSKSPLSKTRTVTGEEFVRGFSQHILPRGFQKVRYYGWMNAQSKIALDEVQWLVWLYLGWTYWLASGYAPQREPVQREPVRCAECGGQMRIIAVVNANCRALIEHSVKFLDSG